ncbi:unnamed protein product [Paramecium sonneborni]|uniref:Uncharacterized protein n=1 Tax=Paramecium sonneborni TaxID=65129 RepID=A0A8S1RST5_9CILI|nr:unnamed protein product [Paramecium sonneborni]
MIMQQNTNLKISLKECKKTRICSYQQKHCSKYWILQRIHIEIIIYSQQIQTGFMFDFYPYGYLLKISIRISERIWKGVLKSIM